MRIQQVFVTSVALLLCACSHSFNTKTAGTATSAELLSIWRADTTDHLAYMGSDEHFHYIFHSRLGDGDSYRVPREELRLPRTFAVGAGEPYVITRDLLQHQPAQHP
jgi:hypothetical protein